MTLTIYTDGGSLNNPGEAAIAYVIYLGDELVEKYGKSIGVATNNIAEYTALKNALEYTKSLIYKHKISSIKVCADSELMVKQLNGLYKVKSGPLKDLLMQIRILESELHTPITYTHVLRGENELADSLVKKALGR